MNVDLLHLWTAAGTFAKGDKIVLAIMSFLSLTVAITKLISIMRSQTATRKFAPEFSRAIQEENLERAITLAEQNKKSHVARVVGEALSEVKPLLSDRRRSPPPTSTRWSGRSSEMLITLADFKRGMGIMATVRSPRRSSDCSAPRWVS
jgi:biopolymer transport protein ExbB/biopolymer transport protein TolQ